MEKISEIETQTGNPERANDVEMVVATPGLGVAIAREGVLAARDEIDGVKTREIAPVGENRGESGAHRVRRIVAEARAKLAEGRAAVDTLPTAGPTLALGSPAALPVPKKPEAKAGRRRGVKLATTPAGKNPDEKASRKRLAKLETDIRSEVDGLLSVLDDALTRKLRLGELLIEARAACDSLDEDWATFLESFGLKVRNAREAIQFYSRRAEIEEKRHDGAALTVTMVRASLTRPRAESTTKEAGEIRDAVRPDDVMPSRRAVPSPSPQGKRGEDVVGFGSASRPAEVFPAVAVEEVPDHLPVILDIDQVDDSPPVAVPIPASPASPPDDSVRVEEGCAIVLDFLEEQVARLASGEADPALESLELAAPKLREVLQRLDAALRARRAVA